MSSTVPVYLEVGNKKVFACAYDWPGWCRSGRNEEAALEALADYAARYAPVARAAKVEFDAEAKPDVAERVRGDASTDFGVPGAITPRDRGVLATADARRLAKLVAATWQYLDGVGRAAPPQLRKGPRGGGRDRDEVLQHVVSAESMYARKLGMRMPEPRIDDRDAVGALRSAIEEAIATGRLDENPKSWPPAYAARRIAWHVLDHAWEIEDRSS